jgi:arginine-tRNA-protein transferase
MKTDAASRGWAWQAYAGHSRLLCPYLPDREARLMYLHGDLAGPLYRRLLDGGYRRSGMYLYRPDCPACNECKVLRVPVAEFKMTKEQRRIWNRGRRLFTVERVEPEYSDERAAILKRYLEHQHARGEDAPRTRESYEDFYVNTCLGDQTIELQLRKDGVLVGVGVIDVLDDAVSSVNFFFDPSVARYSPGTFSALAEIDLARQWGKTYYYLGYYIAGCRTMNYKARFRPCQIKDPDAEWPRDPAAPGHPARKCDSA